MQDNLTVPTSVQCACCEEILNGEERLCHNCQMPIQLSAKLADRAGDGRFVSVIGPSGAGKTVYLGFLMDILTKGSGHLHGHLTDAFSVAVQQETIGALQSRTFPQKTSTEADTWNWVHCEVNGRGCKQPLDLVTPDLAGEAIEMEMDYPNSFPVIRWVVSRSNGILLLIDASRVGDDPIKEDLCALKFAAFAAGCLSADRTVLNKKGRITIPLAVLLTKCDECPDVQLDPTLYATSHLPRLHNHLQSSFGHFYFFATGVAGTQVSVVDDLGRMSQLPIHTELYGMTQPIEWIIDAQRAK